ncbi:hypothetical protein TrVE_jg4748 [Triparma verrucosa]|uniref:Protein kinase domain-containing protein n=1 Tax=Triparma verrucosa TaxID=1606542 RepID=A0A9W7F911_9STRA|nr:hypothetical protein TrVE_jg4748 [Triparma verrucosa]
MSASSVDSDTPYTLPPSPTAPITQPPPAPSHSPSQSPSRSPKLSPSDFLFGRTLGEGAFARVVHARYKTLQPKRDYAVKIMEKRHIKKEDKVKYVMMEKRLLSSFECPLVIRLHVSFQDSDYLYMVMDLCPGGELLGVIRSFRDTEMETACGLEVTQYYMGSVIKGLEYLHSRQIIHRDLKPENVLLLSSGHVKIGDFGTALDLRPKEGGSGQRRNSFVGTAEYVSPEVLRNEDAGVGVDLWAVGCMVFQMAVGRPPFQAANEFGMFQAIIDHAEGKSTLQYPPALSGHPQNFIDCMLKDQPESRLGAKDGVQDGGEDGKYTSIREHGLFEGFDWEKFESGEMVPPYKPPAADWLNLPDSSLMDGDQDLEEYFLEGDATPLEIMTKVQGAAVQGSSSESNEARGSIHEQTVRDVAGLSSDETIIKMGKIAKRKGFFTKYRQLILTSGSGGGPPRLVYIDADSTPMAYKGQIPWSEEHPVKTKKLSESRFDVISVSGKGETRAYHLTENETGSCDEWIKAIDDMLRKGDGY